MPTEVRAMADDRPDAWVDPFDAAEYFTDIRKKRVFAYLIDLAIVLGLNIVWWIPGALLSLLTLFAVAPFFAAGSALLPIAYHSYFIGTEGNATPGMRIMGIRVAVWNGQNPGYLQAFVQTVLFYVSVPLTNGLILLVSLFNERGRCLHDLLCGTVAVNVADRPELGDMRSGSS